MEFKYNYHDYNTFKEYKLAYQNELLPYAGAMRDLQRERNVLNTEWSQAEIALQKGEETRLLNYQYKTVKLTKDDIIAKNNIKAACEAKYKELVEQYNEVYKIYNSILDEWKIAEELALAHFKRLQDEHDKKVAKLTKERLVYEFYEKYNCSYDMYKKLADMYGFKEASKMVRQNYVKGTRPEV